MWTFALERSENKNNCFICFKLPKIGFFIYLWLLNESYFLFLMSAIRQLSTVILKSKRNVLFYWACFYFYLQLDNFHTAAFFSSQKMTIRIFSHFLWYHYQQTEQNAVNNPLSFVGLSSKYNTRNLQYNAKRCVTSFPRLICSICCGNGVIVSFSNCVLIDNFSFSTGCKFFVQVYVRLVAEVLAKIPQSDPFSCC